MEVYELTVPDAAPAGPKRVHIELDLTTANVGTIDKCVRVAGSPVIVQSSSCQPV